VKTWLFPISRQGQLVPLGSSTKVRMEKEREKEGSRRMIRRLDSWVVNGTRGMAKHVNLFARTNPVRL
jgi:hypothetical protein